MKFWSVFSLLAIGSAYACGNHRVSLSSEDASKLAEIALEGVSQEYPNQIAHKMESDADVHPPRDLTPTFYGCYDWHSAVHTHWQLVRLLRTFPDLPEGGAIRRLLSESLSEARVAVETEYMARRPGFERPYGLAWLMQLSAELHEWAQLLHTLQDGPGTEMLPEVSQWRDALEPLVAVARENVAAWLPKLTHPVRIGEHAQTAFGLGLMIDYARTVGDEDFEDLLTESTLRFYSGDKGWSVSFEPSGHDFVSPSLGEADVMRRVLSPAEFGAWLEGFLPDLPASLGCDTEGWMLPVEPADRSDGKLAHFDGLNLSRSWMLEGMAKSLGPSDPRSCPLLRMASDHGADGMASVLDIDMDYMGSHWLGSFAVYLSTCRGL